MTGLGGVLAGSLRVYRVRPWLVVPLFVVAFVTLRLLTSLVPDAGGARRTAVLLLVQVAAPAVVGSLLFAFAVAVLAAPPAPPGRLSGRAGSLLAAAGVSAALSVLFVLLLGPVGLLLQPVMLGPPVLLHAIVLEQPRLRAALARTRAVLRRDARVPAYVSAAVVLTAVVQVLAVSVAAELAGAGEPGRDLPAALRVAQGVAAGVTLPYVAAVGLLAYRDANPPAPLLPS
jgi:hypothetical protein